ncbi:MAG: putative capsular polysaccharide synthesis family protein [Anaerolineales bacterium]
MTNLINKLIARPKSIAHWDPIIVYQMGKVGSASVQRSLIATFRSMGVDVAVHHIHNLHNLEAMEKSFMQGPIPHEDTLMGIRLGLALKKQMDEDPKQQWNLISLVREPVARSISEFFQGFQEIIPDYGQLYERGQLSMEEVRKAFFLKSDQPVTPHDWFDRQMKTVFDIDVYAQPFPTHQGYKFFRDQKRTPLLVIRLEDLDRVAGRALKEFLGIENFSITKSNAGTEKQYATLYSDFKKSPLPTEYLEKKYNTKYAKHFYTDDEREKFYRKWASSDEK